MRCLIALAFIALASGQGHNHVLDHFRDTFNNQQNKYDYTIDFVHNYRFEEHEHQHGKHLIVAISDATTDRSCHIIEVSNSWASYLDNKELLQEVTEELYNLLKNHNATETDLSRDQLRQTYGDTDALTECYNHKVYLLTYTPSFLGQTTTAGHVESTPY